MKEDNNGLDNAGKSITFDAYDLNYGNIVSILNEIMIAVVFVFVGTLLFYTDKYNVLR